MAKTAKLKLNHPCWRIFEVQNIELPYHRMPGVYKIGSVYIGASNHVQKRIKDHFNSLKNGTHQNKSLKRYFNLSIEMGVKIPVYILDDNPCNEFMWKKYYNIFSKGFGLKGEVFYHEMIQEA